MLRERVAASPLKFFLDRRCHRGRHGAVCSLFMTAATAAEYTMMVKRDRLVNALNEPQNRLIAYRLKLQHL